MCISQTAHNYHRAVIAYLCVPSSSCLGFSTSQGKTGCELETARQGLLETHHLVGNNSNFHVCEIASWFHLYSKDFFLGQSGQCVVNLETHLWLCVKKMRWGKDTCLCEAWVTLPSRVEMVVFNSALCLACHVTSGKTCLLAGPQVTPLEACVSGVGTQSPLGFFNFNQVFPGFLTQVLGCSKWVCFILNQNHRDTGRAGGLCKRRRSQRLGAAITQQSSIRRFRNNMPMCLGNFNLNIPLRFQGNSKLIGPRWLDYKTTILARQYLLGPSWNKASGCFIASGKEVQGQGRGDIQQKPVWGSQVSLHLSHRL